MFLIAFIDDDTLSTVFNIFLHTESNYEAAFIDLSK